jgi:F-type H+-transporting ATPase subunit b
VLPRIIVFLVFPFRKKEGAMRKPACSVAALSLAGFAMLSLAASPALAAGSAFPPFDSKTFTSQLFWLFLTFGTLYLLMSKVALPRVGSILEERRETIASALSAASDAQKQAEAAALAHEQALAKAKADGQAIAQDARAKSTRQIDAARQKAEAENAAKLTEAEARITAMKTEAMGNVASIAQEATTAILEQLSGKAPAAKTIAEAVQAASETR